ncbi:hypothetical protein CEXT_21731 [Caerostris extrusa]|uniref:Uncharacterized protein n=1 Tax=Caerostris extrusa TaxID=172846 RepID=A0AAV4XWP6_CAEEX|nr:hypothetical protein CEXT_21731 [Caerostris extrusa]
MATKRTFINENYNILFTYSENHFAEIKIFFHGISNKKDLLIYQEFEKETDGQIGFGIELEIKQDSVYAIMDITLMIHDQRMPTMSTEIVSRVTDTAERDICDKLQNNCSLGSGGMVTLHQPLVSARKLTLLLGFELYFNMSIKFQDCSKTKKISMIGKRLQKRIHGCTIE